MSNETAISVALSTMSNSTNASSTSTIATSSLAPTLDDTNMAVTSETFLELLIDFVMGLLFLGASIVSAERLKVNRSHEGSETTIVQAFYTLIFLTSLFRTLYFLIPKTWLQPRYTPSAIMAFSTDYPKWFANYLSEAVKTLGSLCLYSIFILILVYWSDILMKYFLPGARRAKPMKTFVYIVSVLLLLQVLNSVAFFSRWYSTEGMILVNSVLLSVLSIVCMVQLLKYSRRFRAVLKTLGTINAVPTESQDQRIKWITLTGNSFFISRALLEVSLAATIFYHYWVYGNVDQIFSHKTWDVYTLLKYGFEFAILCLMLYILKSQFNGNITVGVGGDTAPAAGTTTSTAKYEPIPEKGNTLSI